MNSVIKMPRREGLPSLQRLEIQADVERLRSFVNDNKDKLTPEWDSITTQCGTQFTSYESETYYHAHLCNYKDAGFVQTHKSVPNTPLMDERNYTELKSWAKDSYLDEFLCQFSAPPMRTRLAFVKPGGFIMPHIDFNTDIGIRCCVPIYTNPWCYFGVRRKGEEQAEIKHLSADGRVWFFNQGFEHAAWNFGKTPRVHLLFTLQTHDEVHPQEELRVGKGIK